MAAFPNLTTGAVTQYPGERQTRFSTQVVEFIDGQEQRFRDYARPLRRWVIRLSSVDAGELQAILNFFDATGPETPFSFTDPWDNTVHPSCVLEGGEVKTELMTEWSGRSVLSIRENWT